MLTVGEDLKTLACLILQKKQMRSLVCILFLVSAPTNLYEEKFVIDAYRCSNYIYTCIVKHIFESHNHKKEISLFHEDDTIFVSYANYRVSFCKLKENDNVFSRKKGKYIVNLFIEKNECNRIVKAYFMIVRKNKKIAEILLNPHL